MSGGVAAANSARSGFPATPPPLVMTRAQAPPARGPLTAGSAGRTAEHRVSRVEYQHVGAELRPDRRDQLLPHPRRAARPASAARQRSSALITGAHCPASGSSPKTVAVSRILT